MKRTVKELEVLKQNWRQDPCWDLYETEEFEEHREELKSYQEKWEVIWEKEAQQREEAINLKAQQLGVKGLYCLILKHEELLQRHNRAIEFLSDNKTLEAYRALRGIE